MAKRNQPSSDDDMSSFMNEKNEMMASLSRAMQQQSFQSPEEAQAFLDQFVGQRMGDVTKALRRTAETPEDKAEALVIEAMQSDNPKAIRKNLDKALKLDPSSVRAMIGMSLIADGPEGSEQWLRKAIAAGETVLSRIIAKASGNLWAFTEARPYLEARERLAEVLRLTDRFDEATAEYQAILKLNEGDHQGVRYWLIGLLMEWKRWKEAEALWKQYDDDAGADWAYARALIEFQKLADRANWATPAHDIAWMERQTRSIQKGVMPEVPKEIKGAAKYLHAALKANRHCMLMLINDTGSTLEASPPQSNSLGSEEEAELWVHHQSGAWASHPCAMLWLIIELKPWLMKHGYGGLLAS